ncbi:trigger factor [Thermus scotoductus]|uniref:Trigger factor n=1 Tax=Thermus scotoductus TaxID=37636 RepID=A0A430UGB6_THESC|nr:MULTISPECIES: trigger factor [Thermus]RTG92970.1 trigger factor [Thermus scotoductus]RTH00417.1 trigger factor [Thermus scotoductus]RTH12412.1 trigger factor [Thermus scotoductus]RTH12688.1 trigger factor [Thermus scotoductus]RTH13490.1 trigger factor [Thermus scotoductus]
MAEILERSGYRVKVRVEVPKEKVEERYQALLRDVAKRVRIPGFRPGKAPLKVVEARIGREELLSDLKERLVEETYPLAVQELGLLPVAARVVEEELSEGEGFRYVAEVENYPEVQLPDWRSFDLQVAQEEVTEEMVDKALEELRHRYAELVPVDREAQEKDHVFVRTEEGSEFPIDLSKALPHVREALLGKRAGEVVMVPVLNEKGEKVREVRTEILEVKTLELPKLDDEFAKTLEAESLEELREKVRQSLKRQAEARYQEARERAFLEKLAEGLEAEIPPSMLEAEERHLLEHLAEDLARQGIPLEAYLKALEEKGEFEKFREELRQEALKRVKRSLAKERLAEELKPEVSEEEWQAYLQAVARSYGISLQELRREFGERGLARLRAAYIQDKAVKEALAKLL